MAGDEFTLEAPRHNDVPRLDSTDHFSILAELDATLGHHGPAETTFDARRLAARQPTFE